MKTEEACGASLQIITSVIKIHGGNASLWVSDVVICAAYGRIHFLKRCWFQPCWVLKSSNKILLGEFFLDLLDLPFFSK